MIKDIHMVYEKAAFPPPIQPVTYRDEFFLPECHLESDIFYDLRKNNDIKPYRIIDGSPDELQEIKNFFRLNQDTFFFYFNDNNELLGSILCIDNRIQSLCVARKHQRTGIGSMLTSYAVNFIRGKGHPVVELDVLPGNEPALRMYLKLGFRIQ